MTSLIDAHRRQHHDVDRRVRVEPEHVLEQHRVAAPARVEEAEVPDLLDADQHDGEADDRRRQHLDDAGGVDGPDEERQAHPAHAGRAQRVDRDDEVEAGDDRREAEDEDAQQHREQRRRRRRAVGRVERPAGVGAAHDHAGDRQRRAGPVEVERQQVQPREGDVLGAQHERQHEVAEHARDRRDHEHEDHDHAVQREHAVVGVRAHDGRLGREELDAQRHREDAAQQEREQHRHEVHDADALVVDRGEPRPDAPIGVQVVDGREDRFGALSSGLDWLIDRFLRGDVLETRLRSDLMNSTSAAASGAASRPL